MKIIRVILILFFISSKSFAEFINVPNIGDVIKFYPLEESVKSECKGFDCFYDAMLISSKGKIKFSPKFRYKKTSDNLTPFEVIEDKEFVVEKCTVYNPTNKIQDKKYLVYLTTEDEAHIVLSIPYYTYKKEKEYNVITRALMLSYKNDIYGIETAPCLPFYKPKDIKAFENKYLNKIVLRNPTWNDEKRCFQNANVITSSVFFTSAEYVSYVTSISGAKLDSHKIEQYYSGKVEDLKFVSIKGFAFKQPFVQIVIEGYNYNIPLYDLAGTIHPTVRPGYSFCDNYILESKYISDATSRIDGASGYIVNEPVFYGGKSLLSKSEIGKIAEDLQDQYGFLKKGIYTFNGYNVSEYYNKYCLYANLSDDKKNTFRIRVSPRNSIDRTSPFVSSFSRGKEMEMYAQIKNEKDSIYKAELTQKNNEEKVFLEKLAKKQGRTWVDYYNNLYSDALKDKFIKASNKWGVNVAKDICEKKVKIGWSAEKCIMSWGYPEDINTTKTASNCFEQFCYKYDRYLYFKNGILQTIQN